MIGDWKFAIRGYPKKGLFGIKRKFHDFNGVRCDSLSVDDVAMVLKTHMESLYHVVDVSDMVAGFFRDNLEDASGFSDKVYLIDSYCGAGKIRVWIFRLLKNPDIVVVGLSLVTRFDDHLKPGIDDGVNCVYVTQLANIGYVAVRSLSTVIDDFKAILNDGPYSFGKNTVSEYFGYGNILRAKSIDWTVSLSQSEEKKTSESLSNQDKEQNSKKGNAMKNMEKKDTGRKVVVNESGGYLEDISIEAVGMVLKAFMEEKYQVEDVTHDMAVFMKNNDDGIQDFRDEVYLVSPRHSNETVRVWIKQPKKSVIVEFTHVVEYDDDLIPVVSEHNRHSVLQPPVNIGYLEVHSLKLLIGDFKTMVDDGPYFSEKETDSADHMFYRCGNICRAWGLEGEKILQNPKGIKEAQRIVDGLSRKARENGEVEDNE